MIMTIFSIRQEVINPRYTILEFCVMDCNVNGKLSDMVGMEKSAKFSIGFW